MVQGCDLATELIDHIFTYLIDDNETCAAGTLVSSQWHFSARRALFHTIVLYQDDISTLGADGIKTLCSPPANTAQLVKKLYLTCPAVTTYQLDHILSIFPNVHIFTLLRTKLMLLPDEFKLVEGWKLPRNIQSLRLHGVTYYMHNWSSKAPSDDNEFKYWAPGPRENTDAFETQIPQSSLVQFLNLFSDISTLSLYEVTPGGLGDQGAWLLSCGRWPVDYSWYYRPTFRSALWAEGQRLSSRFTVKAIMASERMIRGSFSGAEIALSIIAYSPSAMSQLRHLDIAEQPTVTSELLRRAAPTLTHLRMQLLMLLEELLPSKSIDSFGFDRCKSLTDLDIALCIEDGTLRFIDGAHVSGEDLRRQHFRQFLRLISISAKTFRHFTLRLRCFETFLARYDWEAMDTLLGTCHALTDVCLLFGVYMGYGRDDVEKGEALTLDAIKERVRTKLVCLREKLGDRLQISLQYCKRDAR